MKTNKFSVLFIALFTFLLCGCDSNVGKVEELSTQFVKAFNESDKATIYDLFPEVKTYENLFITGTIGNDDDVSVEKIDSTGDYLATINELKNQRLLFKVDSIGGLKIIDSYAVFRLDSTANEIALKTGVPVKKISDLELGKLMNAQGDFINDIKHTKNTNYIWATYGAYSWGRNSSGYYVSMNFSVQNNSTQTISGKDYYLTVIPSRASTGETYNTKTIDGVDLAPNEIHGFNALEPPLYRVANERDLAYKVEVHYRSESFLTFLLNYCKFEGNEYDDYMLHPARARIMDHGVKSVVSSAKKGYAYAYKDMSDKLEVVDTLYDRKGVTLLWETETWASAYTNDYKLIGYMQAKDIDTTESISELELAVMELVKDKGPINIYDISEGAPADKVIKTYPAGKKNVLIEFDEDGGSLVYERQPDGSVKKIGRIETELLEFGIE